VQVRAAVFCTVLAIASREDDVIELARRRHTRIIASAAAAAASVTDAAP